MKIRKINTINHYILGDLSLNFIDSSGKTCETIILAGDNGCGKSSILNLIYEFTQFKPLQRPDEMLTFEVELMPHEISVLRGIEHTKQVFSNIETNIFTFSFNMLNNKIPNWANVNIEFTSSEDELITENAYAFNSPEFRKFFRSQYSDAEISFNPRVIQAVTTKNVDEFVDVSTKSTPNLASDIKQLLIDIQAIDDADVGNWARKNPNSIISNEIVDIRTKRFRNAFNEMFPSKKYIEIRNISNKKEVIFEENGKEMYLEQLSSGEKQIVFRGGFFLKNKNMDDGITVLIDEPEISLHPKWQSTILPFYQSIFTNPNGVQTSQLIVATHSPFIIHNKTRKNDKVIILEKSDIGQITCSSENAFYGWTDNQIVEEAFNLNSFTDIMNERDGSHLIITEGKTDWKHLKRAYAKLKESGHVTEELVFHEYEDDIDMGGNNLLTLCDGYSKIPNSKRIIAIFDRDDPKVLCKTGVESYKNWGNNVYSILLPVPEHRKSNPNICIEHYYSDSEIKTYDSNNRRLYVGNEFNKTTGAHDVDEIMCRLFNKIGAASNKIIDSQVYQYGADNSNIALPKNDFAKNIVAEKDDFGNFGYMQFKELFDIIESIIPR